MPSGVFGVMLLTKYPYLENRTLWVEYNGYKFSDGSYIRELREIVNTSSIYNSNDYTMSYSGSAWNLTIDNINFLNNVN